jgi:D-alanyl-D-alanine carboxypeptidase
VSVAVLGLLLGCAEETSDPLGYVSIERSLIDCTERTDTGYVNGNPYPITVVSVDGKPVERETANAYWVMQQAAARDGVSIRIVSGFRTYAEQEYLYNCYINCNCNNCNLAAAPGYSNHQSGHALDLNTSTGAGVLTWLNNNGAAFGFSRTVPSEDWHWEWWGGGPGGGPCTGQPCAVIPPSGGVLDDGGPCFQALGPSQYWRQVTGEGNEGGLMWTNAFVSAEPSCWGRWNLHLEAAGRYTLEVNTGAPYGVWPHTRYSIRHASGEDLVIINQSLSGWQELGVFDFAAGGEQNVNVFDNYSGTVGPDQHIMADALRLTPWSEPQPDPDPEAEPELQPEPEPELAPEPEPELLPDEVDEPWPPDQSDTVDATEPWSEPERSEPTPELADTVESPEVGPGNDQSADIACACSLHRPTSQRLPAWGWLALVVFALRRRHGAR